MKPGALPRIEHRNLGARARRSCSGHSRPRAVPSTLAQEYGDGEAAWLASFYRDVMTASDGFGVGDAVKVQMELPT